MANQARALLWGELKWKRRGGKKGKGKRREQRALDGHEKTGERGEKRVRVEKRQASRSKYPFVHTTLMYSMYVSLQYLPADIFLMKFWHAFCPT